MHDYHYAKEILGADLRGLPEGADYNFFDLIASQLFDCGVNPIWGANGVAGIKAKSSGQTGELRPGRGGSGGFQTRGGRHQGIDIAASVGTPVHANRSGQVVVSGYAGGYGNSVIIRRASDAYTLYAHLRPRQAPELERESQQERLLITRDARGMCPNLSSRARITCTLATSRRLFVL